MYARTLPQRFLFNVALLGQAQLQRIIRYYDSPVAYDSHREDATTDEQWKIYMSNFLWLGEPFNFAANKMIAAGIISRPEWDIYTDTANDSKILFKSSTPGHRKTAWHPDILAGCRGMNVLRQVRMLIKYGSVPIVHATHPKATPPTLLVSRSTAAQPTQHSQKRIRATWLAQAKKESEKKPERSVFQEQTQPQGDDDGRVSDSLRFESDRIERVMASHRYPARVDAARVSNGMKYFSVQLWPRRGSERVMELRDELALALGAANLSIRPYPQQGYALISAAA